MNRELCIQLELFSIPNSSETITKASYSPNIRNAYPNGMFKQWMGILLEYINKYIRYFDLT